MSGLDLRHGGRALREKKREEKSDALRESSSMGGYQGSIYGVETQQDLSKYGLNNMQADDAWPFLRAKLLIIFEGEDLRLPVEDFNRLVTVHQVLSLKI
ncbi:hypothetical protein M7I_5933 [Glarea lozoyensis 74030]|uniref:Uncharacterized protein n=1 Tax=Glarea lozoyensis (strain ATCC 74030 / MF5533) TaxID=1104152 RepID=H0ET78_GLAL7|nr:hypothetical protein M7I_5933 [Glarea lozoyensis 74030]